METINQVRMVLRHFDAAAEPCNEYQVNSELLSLRPEDRVGWNPPDEYNFELTAFAFHERVTTEAESQYTWFAPMMSRSDESGMRREWPSVNDITPEMLRHWIERSRVTKHPVLTARYAGLAWEFSRQVLSESAPISMAQKRVDAVVEMANVDAHDRPTDVFRKLGHAMNIAIAIHDPARTELVRDAIIAHERKVTEDDKLGLWGHAFDLLYDNQRALLTDTQRHSLIAELEARLQRVSNPQATPEAVERWAAESAAQRLAIHFRKLKKQDDVRRVLRRVEHAFEHRAKDANGMLKQDWFEQVERLYRRFNLEEDASRMRRKIREVGPAVNSELVQHQQTFEIKKEDRDAFIDDKIGTDLDQAIVRVAVYFVSQRKATEEQLRSLSRHAALMFMMTRKILGEKGRHVASIGPLEEDLDGHIAAQTAQNISVTTIWLRWVIQAMEERLGLSTQQMMDRIGRSPIFGHDKHDLIRRGFEAYFKGDIITAIHLLIPQVEDTIRTLIELAGGDVFKPNRQNGMDYRTLDDLLRDPTFIGVMSNDVAEYFRIMYTDRRGINLRNRVAHGLIPAEGFGQGLADRLLHTFLVLLLVRSQDDDDLA